MESPPPPLANAGVQNSLENAARQIAEKLAGLPRPKASLQFLGKQEATLQSAGGYGQLAKHSVEVHS